MITWLVEGLVNNFKPEQTEVAFFFDACTDQSELAFASIRPYFLDQRGYKVHALRSEVPVREVGCHAGLIDLFLTTDCDVLIVAQDDQRFLQPITEPYEKLVVECAAKGQTLGVVGGRDGFERGFMNMASAKHSQSLSQIKLEHGQALQRPLLNSGPLIYPRALLASGIRPDTRFHAFYAWENLCATAHKAGYSNYVMGMDIEHVKFGRVTATNWYTPEISAKDSALFAANHPDFN